MEKRFVIRLTTGLNKKKRGLCQSVNLEWILFCVKKNKGEMYEENSIY